MALRADALVTLEQARLWVKRQINQNVGAEILELAINGYSVAIARFCEREFKPTPALPGDQPVARTFRYTGNGYLSLAPYELRSLGGTGFGGTGSIVVGTDLPISAQWTLAAQSSTIQSDYRLEPHSSPEGTYLAMTPPLVTSSSNIGALRGREVTITGYWGMTEVPPDVEIACLIAVANSYRNPEGFASRSVGEMSFSEAPDVSGVAYSLPPDARALLGPYRRHSV